MQAVASARVSVAASVQHRIRIKKEDSILARDLQTLGEREREQGAESIEQIEQRAESREQRAEGR